MIRQNPIIQRQLTESELAERMAWFEENQRQAAALSQMLTLARQQQRESEIENELISRTSLSLEQLIAIREWLKHNP